MEALSAAFRRADHERPCRAFRSLAALVLGLAAVGLAASSPGAAGARQSLFGPVTGRVVKVLDGGTIEVVAQIWLGQELRVQVRLRGVDAPELNGPCTRARELARAARTLVAVQIGERAVTLSAIQYGKYAGRVVAQVTAHSGIDLAQALIAAGLGRAYSGGARPDWCARSEDRALLHNQRGDADGGDKE